MPKAPLEDGYRDRKLLPMKCLTPTQAIDAILDGTNLDDPWDDFPDPPDIFQPPSEPSPTGGIPVAPGAWPPDRQPLSWEEEEVSPQEIEDAIGTGEARGQMPVKQPLWDVWAWYQSYHYYEQHWGIFIKARAIKLCAREVARFVPRTALGELPPNQLLRELCLSAFFQLHAHEYYHHKVEGLGYRLEVSGVPHKSHHYCAYKEQVYRPSLPNVTDYCLEEALANAHSFLRFSAPIGLHPIITTATKQYLRATFPHDSPGYREASRYLTRDSFREGEAWLQSQVRDTTWANTPHQFPPWSWSRAPGLLKSFLPSGSEPPTRIVFAPQLMKKSLRVTLNRRGRTGG